jgi:hypothetical protein
MSISLLNMHSDMDMDMHADMDMSMNTDTDIDRDMNISTMSPYNDLPVHHQLCKLT